MPKVRQKKIVSENTFVDGADKTPDKPISLNPNNKRNYKNINVPFNEFEYNMLNDAAQRAGRTKLNFIRWAISVASKE
jgi:hypothetical protein